MDEIDRLLSLYISSLIKVLDIGCGAGHTWVYAHPIDIDSHFIVNDETKKIVLDNISYLLNNFISCSVYENIIFCWVMHEQSILDDVLSRLDKHNCILYKFSLVCSEQSLISRITKDIQLGEGLKTLLTGAYQD